MFICKIAVIYNSHETQLIYVGNKHIPGLFQ